MLKSYHYIGSLYHIFAYCQFNMLGLVEFIEKNLLCTKYFRFFAKISLDNNPVVV